MAETDALAAAIVRDAAAELHGVVTAAARASPSPGNRPMPSRSGLAGGS